MSLIEKIDAEITERQSKAFICAYSAEVEKGKARNAGEITGLELAKQIILSEQKEPCEYCTDGVYYDVLGAPCRYNNCPMCGRPLNQPYTE